MKTLKHGNRNEPPKRWWMGKTFTCNCGEEVQFEPTDDQFCIVTEVNERRPGGDQSIIFGCPCCSKSNRMEKV